MVQWTVTNKLHNTMQTIQLRQRDRDKIACVLSVIPGLGHLYKHHFVAGIGILTLGNLLMVFVALWLGLATFGVSLIVVPVFYVLGMAASAYALEDWHGKHHYLHPWTKK